MDVIKPTLYYVDKEYLKKMHNKDYRVSVKYNNRVFAGIIIFINGQKYVIPLTSQTTQDRKKEGKNKRNSFITTFITESSGNEIANLLYNNMIPVFDDVISLVNIDPKKDTYLSNEIRYIRKNWDTIQKKAFQVYNARQNKNSPNYSFLCKTCCDYKLLELECNNIENSSKENI